MIHVRRSRELSRATCRSCGERSRRSATGVTIRKRIGDTDGYPDNDFFRGPRYREIDRGKPIFRPGFALSTKKISTIQASKSTKPSRATRDYKCTRITNLQVSVNRSFNTDLRRISSSQIQKLDHLAVLCTISTSTTLELSVSQEIGTFSQPL